MLQKTRATAAKIYRHFMHDSLYRNSIFLTSNYVLIAGLSLLFWAIAAHSYGASVIGSVVTLSAVVTFLGDFSQLGFVNAIIRFLPKEKDANGMLGTSLSLSVILNLVSTVVAILILRHYDFVAFSTMKSAGGMMLFGTYSLALLLGLIQDAVFIAHRKGGFVLLRNFIASFLKLLLVVMLSKRGAEGLLAALALGNIAAAIAGLYFLYRIGIKVRLRLERKILEWGRFSFANYTSKVTTSLVLAALPILILRRLGANNIAYYYIAYNVSTGLRVIPQSVAQALFAEASYDMQKLKIHASKALKLLSGFLLPIGIIMLIISPYLLLIFGKDYSSAGLTCLRILVVVALLSPINYIGDALLNTQKRLGFYTSMNMFSALSTLALAVPLVSFGLNGISFAWLVSEIITALAYALIYREVIWTFGKSLAVKIFWKTESTA